MSAHRPIIAGLFGFVLTVVLLDGHVAGGALPVPIAAIFIGLVMACFAADWSR